MSSTEQQRRRRVRAQGAARHRGAEEAGSFSESFTALGELAYGGARVSATVLDLTTGLPLLAIDDRVALPTASVGKVLLLIELAARITTRDQHTPGILDKTPDDAIADSGLWHRMQVPTLPLGDLGLLVGAASDNVATNVLLRHIGLDAVRERAESLGLSRTALLDKVRLKRGPDDAPQFSVGATAELAWLFYALSRGQVVDSVTSQRVLDWLSLNADLSMVASAFGLDPLAHRASAHGLQLVNKTGTDAGVRSDVGLLHGRQGGVAYAVTVEFVDSSLHERLRVLDTMRTVGRDILEYVY
ncbi:class A beta-lactamase-related serine hydrolase [Salinibacterium sp. SYSU T00001]|uniref:serine hydrolase n=1 Tax=Homoserinimonas sedimenticola TaxID=2986805 RepID=UPI0022369DBF|nr:serine hydrolase [Salinibacterium sedimenticola]MCW4385846.1 class A beta-lactamase-related serine hydrolase [Salinibacterium sedimenticola]